MTAGQVAARLGIDRRTVWRIARANGIGEPAGPRLTLFTAADADAIARITHGKRGRPPNPAARPDRAGEGER